MTNQSQQQAEQPVIAYRVHPDAMRKFAWDARERLMLALDAIVHDDEIPDNVEGRKSMVRGILSIFDGTHCKLVEDYKITPRVLCPFSQQLVDSGVTINHLDDKLSEHWEARSEQ